MTRKALRLTVVAFVAVALLASVSTSYAATGKMLNILVSPKGLVHSFWLTVRAGADAAGEEFGARIIWKGPALETDIATQIAIIEDYINKGIDGIVMAACDTKALIPVIDKAKAKGIPVVTFDSGVDPWDYTLSFVATDNILGAKKAADALAELIGKKGKVACIPFVPGAATSIMREQGFKEGIAAYKDIKLVAVQYSQSEVATGMAVTENILTAHPDLAGIFAANEAGAIGAAQAIKARGLAGKVKLVGFDAAPTEIAALEEGVIQTLIVQNPYAMGYLGVKTVLDAIAGKEVSKRVDTGVTVVTMKNIKEPEIQKLLYPLGK